MSKYLPVGLRIKEERDRLRHSQAACCALGNVTRKTLFNYESGEIAPAGGFLIEIAAHGYDVQFIVTGVRSVELPTLAGKDAAESSLLAYYRNASDVGKKLIDRMAELEASSEATSQAKVDDDKSSAKTKTTNKTKVGKIVGNGNLVGTGNISQVSISHGEPNSRKPRSKTKS